MTHDGSATPPSGLPTFFRERRGGLLQLARLLTNDHHTAQDVVQEAFMRTLPRWRDITRDGRNPEAYLRSTIRSVSVDLWRKHRGSADVVATVPDIATCDPQLETAPDRIVLATALSRLTPRQRAVVSLRFLDDLTEARTAEILGCSQSTVKSQAREALAKLRRQLLAVP